VTRAALALAALAAAGCADDGPSPSTRIEAPRILAIAADPPVVGLDGAAALGALIVDGDGAAVDAAAARLAIRACSPWIPIQDPAVDCGAGASLPLGLDGEVARLEVGAVLARFPPPPDLDGSGGGGDDPCPLAYPHVDLPIVVEAAVDGVRLTARKHVRLTWAAGVVRTNPRIDALVLGGALAADAEVELTVRPAPGWLDLACDGADPPALVLEPVRVHLYATAGELGAASVDATYDADGVESLETTTYLAPAGGAVLWAIAIDGDSGTGWARFDLAVP
jgi:hypothetical protein